MARLKVRSNPPVAPTLELILSLRTTLENGESLSCGLRHFCEMTTDADLKTELQVFFARYQAGVPPEQRLPEKMSSYRRIVFHIIQRGLEGLPILPHLQEVQSEVFEKSKLDLESFALGLPFKMMIPLLLFLFPAFCDSFSRVPFSTIC